MSLPIRTSEGTHEGRKELTASVNGRLQGIPSLLYRLKVWARAMADICQKGISPPNSHESILVAERHSDLREAVLVSPAGSHACPRETLQHTNFEYYTTDYITRYELVL